MWNDHLHKGLMGIGFIESIVDDCVYTKECIIFIMYVDDGIVVSKKDSSIDIIINQFKERYQLIDNGKTQDYLGIYVEQRADGTIKLSQPYLIDQILADVQPSLDPNAVIFQSFRNTYSSATRTPISSQVTSTTGRFLASSTSWRKAVDLTYHTQFTSSHASQRTQNVSILTLFSVCAYTYDKRARKSYS